MIEGYQVSSRGKKVCAHTPSRPTGVEAELSPTGLTITGWYDGGFATPSLEITWEELDKLREQVKAG